jgi:putative flippase GtrA
MESSFFTRLQIQCLCGFASCEIPPVCTINTLSDYHHIFPPRWAFASHGGLGDPTFVYCQPLFYYFVSFIDTFTHDLALSIKISFILGNLLLALSAYTVLKKYLSPMACMLGMTVIQTLPALFFLQTYCGALPWIFASPFILLFAHESTMNKPRPHILALWLCLLALAHLLSALMVLISIGVCTLAVVIRSKQTAHIQRWSIGVGIGLLLCSPYLFPALSQQHLITPSGWVDRSYLDWRRGFSFPFFTYFLYGLRWFAMQWPLPLLALVMTLCVLWPDGSTAQEGRSAPVLVCARRLATYALVAIFFSSELTYPLYALLFPLHLIQSPYRFGVPAALFAALALFLYLLRQGPKASFTRVPFRNAVAWTSIAASLSMMALLQLGLMQEGRKMPDLTEVMQGEFGQPEYLPASAGPNWSAWIKAGGWPAECSRLNVVCTEELHRSHEWASRVEVPNAMSLRVPLFWFPAWGVYVNGKRTDTIADPDTGLIQFRIPPGAHVLRVVWDGLPAERIGWLMGLAGLVLCVVSATFGYLHRLKRFFGFAAVGALGTLVHYAVLITLVSGLGLSPVLGTGTGALAGALLNYMLNYRYTFASDARHLQAMPRFLLMAAISLGLNVAAVGGLTAYLNLHYFITQVFATGTVFVFNYIVSKTWIFRTPKSQS